MSVSVYPQQEENLAPGFRMDRYELLFPIGSGGMASVWVARLRAKHGFEKLVAIKTILPRFARDEQFQRMFLDEARIASRIHHPNVAQILDLGDEQGVLFLAMEWIEGDALSKLARAVRESGAAFPGPIALRILADVCAGLHAAHELRDRSGAPLGIVHRDVSPHNILINEQGIAKIIDFGIAKARDRIGGDTESGSLRGKVKYMAPEQALMPRSTDRRADVWAVGASLYFLVSGRTPYDGENDVATLTMLASGKPTLPLPDSVEEPIRRVAMRALSWERDQRYATAAELQAALERAMIEIGSTTTSADVAAFCAKHVADRWEARKSSVALALKAAEDRASGVIPPTESTSSLGRSAKVRLRSDIEMPATAADGPVRSVTSEAPLGTAATMTAPASVTSPARKHWAIAAAIGLVTVAAIVVPLSTIRGARRASPAATAAEIPSEIAKHTAAPSPPPVAAVAVTELPPAPSASSSAAQSNLSPPALEPRHVVSTPKAVPPAARRNAPIEPPPSQRRPDYGF